MLLLIILIAMTLHVLLEFSFFSLDITNVHMMATTLLITLSFLSSHFTHLLPIEEHTVSVRSKLTWHGVNQADINEYKNLLSCEMYYEDSSTPWMHGRGYILEQWKKCIRHLFRIPHRTHSRYVHLLLSKTDKNLELFKLSFKMLAVSYLY